VVVRSLGHKKVEVLQEAEDCIDEIFDLIASKKATDEDKIELKELQDTQTEFKELIKDIDNDEMTEEEIVDIITEIEKMQKEAFED
jgi:DNA gyrase/topoisomerase IV subunit A